MSSRPCLRRLSPRCRLLLGGYQERQHSGKNLDEYNFYPFDVNRDNDVMKNKDRIEAFLKTLCRTDMQGDENILSKDEYAKALKGKRHFKDERF